MEETGVLDDDLRVFYQSVRQAVKAVETGLEVRRKDEATKAALRRLAVLINGAFIDLVGDGSALSVYEISVLYGKMRRDRNSFKLRHLCSEMVLRLSATRECIVHSPLWEDYIANLDMEPEIRYIGSVIYFALTFAFDLLAERPDSLWFSTEDQYIPLWRLCCTVGETELDHQLSAIFSGIYADVTLWLSLDSSRAECTLDEARHIIDHHLLRIEAYLHKVGTEARPAIFHDLTEEMTATAEFGDIGTDNLMEVDRLLKDTMLEGSSTVFNLVPMNDSTEVYMLLRFLGHLESSPDRNDALRKTMEENILRILTICLKFVKIFSELSSVIKAPVVKLLGSMLAFPAFARHFVTDHSHIKLLANITDGLSVDSRVESCLSALLEPRFWSPGDPVGALSVLEHHIACLSAFANLPVTASVLYHLRRADAVIFLWSHASDRRYFDPRRTAGKESAVQLCLAAKLQTRKLACDILSRMAEVPFMRKIFSRWSIFQNKETWDKLILADGTWDEPIASLFAKLFPDGSPFAALENGPHTADHKSEVSLRDVSCCKNINIRTQLQPFFPATFTACRRLDYQYVFGKLRTAGTIELPVRAGTCVSSVFLGSKHDTAVLRTDTGHLVGVNVKNLEIQFMSYEDWYHKAQTDMTSVPWDCHKFITTSTDLVSQGTSGKSHLWVVEGKDRFRRLAEYENFQFMRPSLIHKNLAVGHAPVWRKRHGYYFALDMEKQKKLMLLGPLKEEEKHPNFPSFHSSMEVVIFMGSIWDLRSGSLVHRFDHFGGWGNCVDNVFHPNGTQVLINAEVWDLRNYGLIRQVEKLKNSRLQFNSSGDVVYGKHAQKRFDELAIFGAHDYSELEYVPFPGYISNTALDRFDSRLIVSWSGGSPVVIEIGGKDNYDD